MLLAINRRLKKARNKKGFTLIELLVVIAILGVLAAIIIPKVTNNLDNAKKNTDATNQKLLQNALDRYYADQVGAATSATIDVIGDLKTDGYIDEVPPVKDQAGKIFTLSSDKKTVLIK